MKSVVKEKTPKKRDAWNKKYPWEKWLVPGKKVTLKPGTHFKCLSHGLAQQARNTAVRMNLRVYVRILPNSSIVIETEKLPSKKVG